MQVGCSSDECVRAYGIISQSRPLLLLKILLRLLCATTDGCISSCLCLQVHTWSAMDVQRTVNQSSLFLFALPYSLPARHSAVPNVLVQARLKERSLSRLLSSPSADGGGIHPAHRVCHTLHSMSLFLPPCGLNMRVESEYSSSGQRVAWSWPPGSHVLAPSLAQNWPNLREARE